VPWRFSDAGYRSAWLDRRRRRPKTCTKSGREQLQQFLQANSPMRVCVCLREGWPNCFTASKVVKLTRRLINEHRSISARLIR
jgi:hypothetical protein